MFLDSDSTDVIYEQLPARSGGGLTNHQFVD
jgi:hypothetical protein